MARMSLGLIVSFFALAICAKAFAFAINAVRALMLYGFTDSETVFRDLDAAADIFGFLGGIYVATRCYRWITRHRTSAANTEAPPTVG